MIISNTLLMVLETAMNAGLPENLLKRVKHVIGEQEQVKQFELGLKNATPLQELGKLLYESHLSSSKLFENSVPELDYLVELLNSDDEVWGGKINGRRIWRSGISLVHSSFSQEEAEDSIAKYSDKFEVEPKFHSFNPSCGAHPRPSR